MSFFANLFGLGASAGSQQAQFNAAQQQHSAAQCQQAFGGIGQQICRTNRRPAS